MEQSKSNYNHGGYGAGNTRGGRNNGGRGHSSGGVQAGGRGENGRGGTDGGYYPRGRGGRNRNYQPRYSNQQQEQYGDGRDHRVSGAGGGAGGGQQISRIPTYPRQNVDRVPDCFGANQEARAWSRVVSGSAEPVKSPPSQIDFSDLQIQEVPVSSSKDVVEHSKNDAENGYVPIKRPDQGTLAVRSVSLLVNHFPVKYDPSNSIFRYDVDVKLETSSSDRSVKKSIPKSDLRLIQEKLCSDYPDQFPLLKTAYDGEKNIFSAVLLHAGTYNVQLFGKSYTCTIKYGSELRLSRLQDFLNRNAFQIPRDVLQALDVVMKAHLFREKVSVGRGMYPRVHRREDDLRCGVAAIRGIQQSLKVTSSGLMMCTDYSVIPFRKRMPVIEFLMEHFREIQVVNDIGKFRNKVMCALKGLRVGVTHCRTNQKYIVSGLTEKLTNELSFELKDLEGKKEPEIVMLTDYFREKWEKEIVHKGIPCLKLGNGKKPNYVPMEFCVLAEDRRFPKEQLGREAARQLKDLCLLPPDFRRNEICSMMREEYGTGSHGATRLGYTPHEARTVVPIHNFDEELKRPRVWETDQGATSTTDASRNNLATLYRPPFALMYHGPFEKAKEAAKTQDRWLLVNLQSTREFSSHMLNRDTWANEVVAQTITSNFIFWQVWDDTEEGSKIKTYYKLDSVPVTLVIDPVTGQKMRLRRGMVQPENLLEDLLQFMDGSPKDHHFSLSHKRPRENSQAPPPKIQATPVVADGTSEEDEDMRLARALSMETTKDRVGEPSKDLCLLPPDFRRNEREEYGTGSHGGEVIQNFELGVGMNMTAVDGRVMLPPKLKLGGSGGKTITVTVDRFKCHWNLLQGKTLIDGKSLERWALIDFSSGDRWNRLNVNLFIEKLMNRCGRLGVHMEDPIVVHETNMEEFLDVDRIRCLLSRVVEESRRIANGRLQMIICIMAGKDDGYKRLKLVSETEIGVMTQCCLSIHANKASDQFLANLGMKINAKLGGSNVELIERFPRFNGNDHCMFIGADVNHPAASNKSSSSIAAVVGSVNWPAATRYAARISPQSHRKEIVDFGKICLDLVNTYARENGVKPNRIVVFRDGVSDGQFDMVLNKEVVDMKKAIYDEHYRPFVTFVVAQKRHTTRMFLTPDGGESGNVPPGTVVDTTITHPSESDFYLFSHFGGIGTSKPTHYSVIWDENGFSSDEMQKLIYHLCFICARCTKPVSLVPPVYYADLVAYRGRMYQEVATEMESGGSSSFDQSFYNLEPHLKDSMFFV